MLWFDFRHSQYWKSCVSAVYSSEAVRRIDGNKKIGGGSSPKRVCEFGVEIVQMKNDLSDTEAALIENQKFLADLDKDCKIKEAEWGNVL